MSHQNPPELFLNPGIVQFFRNEIRASCLVRRQDVSVLLSTTLMMEIIFRKNVLRMAFALRKVYISILSWLVGGRCCGLWVVCIRTRLDYILPFLWRYRLFTVVVGIQVSYGICYTMLLQCSFLLREQENVHMTDTSDVIKLTL